MIGIRDAAAVGLVPDTGMDVTSRFRTFIQDGLADGAHTFQFEQGLYDFADEASVHDMETFMRGEGSWDLGENTQHKHILIYGENKERIILDFQGSTLRFHGLIQPFSFKGCKEVVIRNVRIDWARPMFSQGEIVCVDAEGLEIQFEPGYPVHSGTPVAAMLDYIPGSAHPIQGTIDWFHFAEQTELVGPQRLRIRYKESFRARLQERKTTPSLGMHVIIRHLMNYKAAFLFYQCERVVLEDITIHTTPGMGVIGHGCGDITMLRLRVMRRPGSDHVMTTNADATHFIGCRGAIDFDDCLFEGMGDDATNVHGFYLSVRSCQDDRTVVCGVDADIQSEYPEIPEAGEVIELTKRETLKPYATLSIDRVEVRPSGDMEIRFKEPLPEGFHEKDLLANVSRIASLRFRNSLVRNNRARAILVQTRNVEISDNTFDHCTGTAIHVNCADGWKESISTDNVRVTRNVFYGCGLGAGTYRQTSALVVMTESEGAEMGVHRSFSFADNHVYGNGARGISIDAVSGAEVRGNRFSGVTEPIHVYTDRCEGLNIS
jgi:hypothetical protein